MTTGLIRCLPPPSLPNSWTRHCRQAARVRATFVCVCTVRAGGLSACLGHPVRLSSAAPLLRPASLHRRVRPSCVGAHRSESAVLHSVRTVALRLRTAHSLPHVGPVVGLDPRCSVASAHRGRDRTVRLPRRRRHLTSHPVVVIV